MTLPIFNGVDKNLSMLQTAWSSMINPFLGRPANQSNILQNVALASGTNVINHRLGRTMQGWVLSDIQGAATIYRSAPFNDLTLTLHSSAAVTVSLEVF
jgi:hypothetical protein